RTLATSSKIIHILLRLNETYASGKMETITVSGQLTVEHILPQQWVDNWSLPDGSKGLTYSELYTADPSDDRAIASRKREAAVQTFGNLTILTQPLNSAVSNECWAKKKPELLHHSLLPINQQLQSVPVWDEESIQARSKAMFEKALK